MKKQLKKVLYFIRSAVPTQKELDAASQLEGNVLFRNASVVTEEDSVEKCDAVAGVVPNVYSKYPRVTEEVTDAPVDMKAKFVSFGKSAGIEEITAESTIEEDFEAVKEYSFEVADLSEVEVAFLKELNLGHLIH